MSEPLITKYRPQCWAEVIGHEEVVRALQRVLKSPARPHAYLFTGPAGLGKTSMARIVASEIGADVHELDAASQRSIDAARELIEQGQFRPLSGAAAKMFLIDEVHGLTALAMDALLKVLEEPPDHLYFALCTTEGSKIKETIVSRCYHVPLRPLRARDIEDLITAVSDIEDWRVDSDVLQMIVGASTGQPRKALSLLQACHDAPSRDEARRIISLLEPSEPIMDMLRDITGGRRSWAVIRSHLQKMGDEDFDGLSATAARYLSTAMVNQENERDARALWVLLDALTFPTASFDRRAAFMAACGRMLFGGES